MDDYYDDDFEQYFDSGESSHKQSATTTSKPVKSKRVQHKKAKKTIVDTVSSPKDRLISSKEHQLREIRNKLTATIKQLQEIERENKTLRRLQIRQEKELHRVSSQEGELPTILQRHNREVMSLRQQLKQSQLNNSDLKKKQNEMSNELWKIVEKKKKLESLSRNRNLLEREKLMMELQDSNETIRERNKKIHELEKSIELLTKTHNHEIKSLMTRNKQTQQQLNSTNQYMVDFRHQLKEKERLLDVSNIYSQRVPQSTSFPPLARMSDVGCQTLLTIPPTDKEMILVTKRSVANNDTQTDSKWNIDLFTTKRNKTASNEDIQPHPLNKPHLLTHNPIVSLGESTPINNTMVTTHRPTMPINNPMVTTHQPINNPMVTTHQPINNPMVTTHQPINNPMVTTHQPINNPMVTTHQPIQPNSTDSPLLKLSQSRQQATPTSSYGTTDAINKEREATSKEREVTPSSTEKATLDKQKKEQLLKKMFPSKYGRSDTSSKVTEETMGIKWNEDKNRTEDQNRTEDMMSIFKVGNTTTSKENVSDTATRRVHRSDNDGVFGDDIDLTEGSSKRDDPSLDTTHNRTFITNNNNTTTTEQSGLLNKLFSNNQISNRHIDQTTSSRTNNRTTISQTQLERDTSLTSLLSKNERIRNLHIGLPSMASDDDPYGTKRRRSDLLLKDTSNDSIKGARHGRRALDNSNGPIFGETAPTNQKTNTVSNTFGGVSAPIQMGGGYPWEQKVELPKQNSTSRSKGVNNSTSRSQGVNNTVFGIIDDDIEELMI